jgi:dienelactone hydrolase
MKHKTCIILGACTLIGTAGLAQEPPIASVTPQLAKPLTAIQRGEPPTPKSATEPGPYQVSQVTEAEGLRDGPDYKGATIYYPVDADPPLASVLIVPGYVSPESAIKDWGPFYASHGIVAMTLGTNRPKDDVRKRAAALLDAKSTLLEESARKGSPLEGRLDKRRIAVSGWSMGGGGAQLAAVEDSSFRAVVALCPWTPGGDFDHAVPVLIFGGTADQFAPFPKNGLPHYQNTPDHTPKLMFEVEGKGHWVANGPQGTWKDRGVEDVGRFALSWLKVFLERDERYRQFLLQKPDTANRFETNLKAVDSMPSHQH